MSRKVRALIGSLAVVAFAMAGFAGNTMAAQHAGVSGTIFFIGPETYTGRWVRDDADVRAEVKKLCSKCSYVFQNGNNEYQTQLQDAQTDLGTPGKKVIILAAVNSKLDAGIVDRAAQQKVPVIAYDRMIEDAKLSSYVSFDGNQVGKLQAKYLLWALAQRKVHSGNVVQIWGSADDDNALLFRSAFARYFDSHFKCPASSPDTCGKSGAFTDSYHTYTPGWVPSQAATEIQTALSNVHNKVVAVYSMNDGMADTVSPALANVGLGHIPLTGQDGEPSAEARILEGNQGMTVYKPIPHEADPAVQAAVWYLSGHSSGTPPGFRVGKNSQCQQSISPHRKIPCVISGVYTVTNKPIKALGSKDVSYPVTDGFTTWSAVCADVTPNPPSRSKKYCGLKH